MQYTKIVQDIIDKHKDSPIDMLGIGDDNGEFKYLNSSKDSYIRTVRDIDELYQDGKTDKKILEIGSFLGTVSISLKELGYRVYALDIPEFQQSASLKSLYEKNNISFEGLNLRKCQLPYESDFLDVVIMCEVMEHLNFNPLPVLKEINRVLKKDGYIYIGMPNQSSIVNRIKMLFGKSIHNGIDDFFKQLDKNDNMIVGLHWREYTLSETIQILEKMGFEVTKKYYFANNDENKSLTNRVIKKLLYSIPSFRPYQVVVGKKVFDPDYNFWITDANS